MRKIVLIIKYYVILQALEDWSR